MWAEKSHLLPAPPTSKGVNIDVTILPLHVSRDNLLEQLTAHWFGKAAGIKSSFFIGLLYIKSYCMVAHVFKLID